MEDTDAFASLRGKYIRNNSRQPKTICSSHSESEKGDQAWKDESLSLPSFPALLCLHEMCGRCTEAFVFRAASHPLTVAHCLQLTQHLHNREREKAGNGAYSLWPDGEGCGFVSAPSLELTEHSPIISTQQQGLSPPVPLLEVSDSL